MVEHQMPIFGASLLFIANSGRYFGRILLNTFFAVFPEKGFIPVVNGH
jgi:hypothetical protein